MRLLSEKFLFCLFGLFGLLLALLFCIEGQVSDKELIVQETKESLAILSRSAEDKLAGRSFEKILAEGNMAHYPSDFQIDYLHKILQPIAESLVMNGIGVAYYDAHRDSVLANGPATLVTSNVLQPLPMDHPSRWVLETKQPLFTETDGVFRGSSYVYTYPLMENGQIYGLIATTIPKDFIQKKLDKNLKQHLVMASMVLFLWLGLLPILYYNRKTVYDRLRLKPWTELIQVEASKLEAILTKPKYMPPVIHAFLESTYHNQQIVKRVLNHASTGILIMSSNKFVFMNRKLEEITGYTLEDMNEMSLSDRFLLFDPQPGNVRITNLLYHDKIDQEIVSEYYVTTKDNVRIPMEARAFTIGTNGKVEGLVISFYDLREYQQFRRLQTQTTLLLESMNEGIPILHEDGTIAYMNRAFEQICSTNRADWIGKMIFEARMDESLSENLHLVLDGHSSREHLNPKEFLNRTLEHFSLDILPLETQSQSQMKGALLIGRDVTTEWQWSELSKRTDLVETLSKMAASMAHEVRNPLTSIKGFLQLLSQSQPEPEKLNMYVNVMMQELERAHGIITEYLSLTKSNLVQKQTVSIVRLLDDIRILMESEAVIRGVNLHFYLADTQIQCDPTKIKQVIINLVRNALEATPRGGVVTVISRTSDEEGFIEILVTDSGIGIPEDSLPNVFTPFYTTKKGGTGLGLPVCKQIVEEHNGSIKVTSKPGMGSSFIVQLPYPPSKKLDESKPLPQPNVVT